MKKTNARSSIGYRFDFACTGGKDNKDTSDTNDAQVRTYPSAEPRP